MGYYFKYNFVSPEPIYAIINEEFKGYLDTGAIDNLMYPTYLNKCLNKLGRATYSISEDILYVEDFETRLPDNFFAVREAWLCTEIDQRPYQSANSFYSQSASTTVQISPVITLGTCGNPDCTDSTCTGECMPEVIQAVYKTNHQVARSYKRMYLLKPGNISARKNCDVEYTNAWDRNLNIPMGSSTPGSSGIDSFDIRDNKFVTNFRYGTVHLIFYATDYDNGGNQLIPDNFRIKEYIEAFIKYKLFETLCNQTNDETFNQLQQKMMYYKGISDETYIIALSEIRSQTSWDKQRRIKQTLNRFNMYELPNQSVRYGRRRNN